MAHAAVEATGRGDGRGRDRARADLRWNRRVRGSGARARREWLAQGRGTARPIAAARDAPRLRLVRSRAPLLAVNKIAVWLGGRWAPWVVIAIGVALAAPAITADFTSDDQLHRLLSRPDPG